MPLSPRIITIFISIFILQLPPLQALGTLQNPSCCSKTYNAGTRAKLIASENGCICKEIPDGYSICYNNRQNSCKKFPEQIMINTTELILRSTSIEQLIAGDFSNLGHLKALTIEGNLKLQYIQESVFHSLLDLNTLNIISNPLLINFLPDTFQGLVNLKELKVVRCGLLRLGDLTNALQPRNLPNLQILNVTGHNFENISANDFDSMKDGELNELDLSSCGIRNIESDALKPLKKLANLHIGGNILAMHSIVELLERTISMGIKLTHLDLDSLVGNMTVPESLTTLIAASNIESLQLSGNHFEMLEEKTIPDRLPNLKILDMTNVSVNFIQDSFYTKIPNVETLILNKHNLSYFSIPKLLPNLKYLDLSEFMKKGAWEFFHLQTELDVTSVEYLDLHSTRLAFLLKDSFKFMPALRELNLKHCTIAKISTGAFSQLNKLTYLNLEDNQFFIMYIKYPSEPFLGLENLETLLLGGNAISYISSNNKNLFKHLTNLKCLGLQKNSLESISSLDFEPLINLEILDISSNPLYVWDDRVFFNTKLEKFYASSNHFTYLSQAMLEDFSNFATLDIDYSPFSCDCRMMRRMYTNKILLREIKASDRYRSLLCAGSHELTIVDYLETTNYLDCEPKKSNMMYFLGSFFAIAFLAAILILVYIVRDQIPYANAFFRSTEGRQNIL